MYVYDVDREAMDSFVEKAKEFASVSAEDVGGSWIVKSKHAKDVGERSVCWIPLPPSLLLILTTKFCTQNL
jgi:hypothetical protein